MKGPNRGTSDGPICHHRVQRFHGPMPDTNDWTADHLNRLSTQDEIHVSSIRRDGATRKPVTMWMVTDDGDVYVRSVKGVDGTWYRHVRATDLAHVTARG